MEPQQDKAVIFTPAGGDVARHVATCLEACEREGIDVVGVAPPGDWVACARLFAERQANVMVVVRRDHIPDDAPRILVVNELGPQDARRRHRNAGAGRPRDRRPNRL
ncbi:hypothetical protein AB0M54_24210 [Actinoplanes sp. NPDC051470]|uniref:hypothetical protein n=1 Tax=Actinoplanes sp. NPDC051470 TaxID=3157224 RepID=UPI00343700CD